MDKPNYTKKKKKKIGLVLKLDAAKQGWSKFTHVHSHASHVLEECSTRISTRGQKL